MNKLTIKNWNYSHFNSEHFKALISIVGEESEGEVLLKYCPTVLNEEEIEVFQKDFDSLEEAIDFANNKYGHWSFTDPTQKEGGCSTCEAH